MSTVGLAVAYAHVTQRARVRSPVGTSFLGEFFRFFSSPVRQMPGSFRPLRSLNIIWQSLSSSLIIHYGRQWPGMLTCTKISNIGYIHTWMSTQFFQMRTHHHWYCNWWFLGTSKQCSVPGCSKDTGRHETPDCRCVCFHSWQWLLNQWWHVPRCLWMPRVITLNTFIKRTHCEWHVFMHQVIFFFQKIQLMFIVS